MNIQDMFKLRLLSRHVSCRLEGGAEPSGDEMLGFRGAGDRVPGICGRLCILHR